jgi:hypothetical protein
MFLTCRARRRYSSPCPCVRDSQFRCLGDAHVALRFPVLAASTTFTRGPKYQSAATSSCSASVFASSSRSPVTMLMTPPGRSEVSCGDDGGHGVAFADQLPLRHDAGNNPLRAMRPHVVSDAAEGAGDGRPPQGALRGTGGHIPVHRQCSPRGPLPRRRTG